MKRILSFLLVIALLCPCCSLAEKMMLVTVCDQVDRTVVIVIETGSL